MLKKLLSAVAAAISLMATPVLANNITQAEATTVAVRAHVHIHYFTVAEMRAIIAAKSGPFKVNDLVLRPTVVTQSTYTIDFSSTHEATGKKEKHKATVQKEKPYVPDPDEDYTDTLICSGFVVNADQHTILTVTARHCMEPEIIWFLGIIPVARIDLTPTRLEFMDGDSAAVVQARPSAVADLALLQAISIRPHTAALTIRTQPLVRGEKLVILGMPGGVEFFLSSAMSAQGSDETPPDQRGLFGGLDVIECSSCFGGDSGAAVLDENGQVVGVVDAGGGQPALTAIVPAYRIQSLIQLER